MSSYDTVLFDLDGTLIDSTALILASYRYTIERFTGQVPDDRTILSGGGIPLRDNLARMNPDPAVLDEMVAVYSEHNAEHHDAMVQPFDGAAPLLTELAPHVQLAIVTGKRSQYAYRGLRLCGLADFFEVVIAPEDTERHKPHADPVLAALVRLQAAASSTLFVGDSEHDIACGRAAGVATAGALWGPNPAAVRESAPDFLFTRLAEVADLVLDGAG